MFVRGLQPATQPSHTQVVRQNVEKCLHAIHTSDLLFKKFMHNQSFLQCKLYNYVHTKQLSMSVTDQQSPNDETGKL